MVQISKEVILTSKTSLVSEQPMAIDDSICAIITANSRILMEEIAKSLNINNSPAYHRLRKLNYVLKIDVWMPHLLSERSLLRCIFLPRQTEKMKLFLIELLLVTKNYCVWQYTRTCKESNKSNQAGKAWLTQRRFSCPFDGIARIARYVVFWVIAKGSNN